MDQAATLRNLMQTRTGMPAGNVLRSPKVVTVTGDETLAPALAAAFSRQGSKTSLSPGDTDADFIFLGYDEASDERALAMYSPNFITLLALGTSSASLTNVFGWVRLLRSRAGISRASIVVNEVTDGREGRRVFQKLKDVAGRSLDMELEYLGHRERDEKVAEVVMKRRFLLDLNDEGLPGPSLELVAKRLRMTCLDWAR